MPPYLFSTLVNSFLFVLFRFAESYSHINGALLSIDAKMTVIANH